MNLKQLAIYFGALAVLQSLIFGEKFRTTATSVGENSNDRGYVFASDDEIDANGFRC
jgi:hypothetical protein